MYFPGIGEFIPGKRFAALPERKSPESEEGLRPEEGSKVSSPYWGKRQKTIERYTRKNTRKIQEKIQGEKKMEAVAMYTLGVLICAVLLVMGGMVLLFALRR